MRSSKTSSVSPRESIEIDRKRLYAYNTYNTHNGISEKRANHCIRYKPSTHRAIKDYCGSRMTMGQFFEEASVVFMQVNPVDRVIVNVENPERPRQIDLQSQVQELICIDDLRSFVDEIKTLDFSNGVVLQYRRRQLVNVLKECKKVKTWGDELSNLIEEANGYFK